MTKKDLLLLVGENNFSELEKKLETILEQENRQDLEERLAQLRGLHNQYLEHKMEGTHSSSELSEEASRLRKSFILFIQKVYRKEPKAVRLGRSRWFWPVIIILFCVVLIGIGSMKWTSIDFVLENGQALYLSFRIEKDLPWNQDEFNQKVYLEEFSAYPVKSAEIDTFSFQIPDGEELGDIRLSGGEIELKDLDIKAGTVMKVWNEDGLLITEVEAESFRCLLMLKETVVEIYNQDINQQLGTDSTLAIADLEMAKSSEGPQISFMPTRPDSMFGFRLLPVSGLSFQQKSSEDNPSLISELKSGEIIAQGTTTPLENKPFVDFIQPTFTTLTFYPKGNHFYVRVEGQAKDVTIGARPDAQKSIKPTIIEHLAQNGQASLIWNWILGIVGLLSAVIGLLPKKKVN